MVFNNILRNVTSHLNGVKSYWLLLNIELYLKSASLYSWQVWPVLEMNYVKGWLNMKLFTYFNRHSQILHVFRVLFFYIGAFSSVSVSANPMDTLGAWSGSLSDRTDGAINLSGYINAHYMKHDGLPRFRGKDLNEPIIQVREASIFADILLGDYVVFSTELEMSYDFSDEDTTGRDESFKSSLNYYYFDFDIASVFEWEVDEQGGLNLRFGRILVPFLQTNENKPNFKQNLMSQPFTAWQFAPVNNVASSFDQFGWTDMGLMINWFREMDAGTISVKASAINGLGVDGEILDTTQVQLDWQMRMPNGMLMVTPDGDAVYPTVRTRDGLFNARSEWDDMDDVNGSLAYTLQVSYSPFSIPLNVGVSWYRGAWNSDATKGLKMWGLHASYDGARWGIKGEHGGASVEQNAGTNTIMMGPAPINTSTGDYNMSASFIEADVDVLQYGAGDVRYVKLIYRYDTVNTNDEAIFTPFDRSRHTFGVEWEFTHNIRLRFEHQRHTLENYDASPMPFRNAGGEENVTMNMFSIIAYF